MQAEISSLLAEIDDELRTAACDADSLLLRISLLIECALLRGWRCSDFRSRGNAFVLVHLVLATACAAFAACVRLGFIRNTAATAFDVFYWLQVTNFGLLNSAPNRLDYVDIFGVGLHSACPEGVKQASAGFPTEAFVCC